MNYSKLQKIVASFLLFLTFFNMSINLGDFGIRVFAADNKYYDLVSLVVDEDLYKQVQPEVDRYARDISGYLEQTKVVILPVPKEVTPYQLATMNEALYFEGYKSLRPVSFNSRLVGSIFIGTIPLPEVQQQQTFLRSVLPYTDFVDKMFVYNSETKSFVKNTDYTGTVQPEIWHSFIAPNTGGKTTDIQAIRDFFKKDHDFYMGTGKYKNTDYSLSGNREEVAEEKYNPYVFYFDQKREEQSLNINALKGYTNYLENKKDMLYGRFTNDLAKKLQEKFIGDTQKDLASLAKNIKSDFEYPKSASQDIFSSMSDIQSRYIAKKSTKNFLEAFASGGIGEMRKNVFNAGRYNKGKGVNMDFIAYMISTLDIINAEVIKEMNTEMEKQVDEFITSGLTRRIIIPESVSVEILPEVDSKVGAVIETPSHKVYHNYLFGNKYTKIKQASDCSFYRGSLSLKGQLVEANRAYNIKHIKKDMKMLESVGDKRACLKKLEEGASLNGFWGKNTPFYIKADNSANGSIALKGLTNTKGAIRGLYDPATGKELTKTLDNVKYTPNPFMCFDNNLILATKKEETKKGDIELVYRLGDHYVGSRWNGSSQLPWSCDTINNADTTSALYFFDHFLKSDEEIRESMGKCEKKILLLDGYKIHEILSKDPANKGSSSGSDSEDCEGKWSTKTYSYKTIDSYMMHKSPTPDTLKAQLDLVVSPNLPIDSVRYIDFIHPTGVYSKFDYLDLFSVLKNTKGSMEYSKVKELLHTYLKNKTKELDEMVEKKTFVSAGQDQYSTAWLFKDTKLFNPESYDPEVAKIKIPKFDYIKKRLRSGTYPTKGLDFHRYLEGKGKKTVTIGGETKEINYYDLVAFALYWDSLDSLSEKYAFVFENYLNEAGTDSYSFLLPKNKNNYEIAYLGSAGDSANMIVSLNPDKKQEHPFADIIAKNAQLSAQLTASNVAGEETESPFKCSPPDGVPLTEWIPAVMCWLKDTMNTQIKIQPGNCGESLLKNKKLACKLEDAGLEVHGSQQACHEQPKTITDSSMNSQESVVPNENIIEADTQEKDKKQPKGVIPTTVRLFTDQASTISSQITANTKTNIVVVDKNRYSGVLIDEAIKRKGYGDLLVVSLEENKKTVQQRQLAYPISLQLFDNNASIVQELFIETPESIMELAAVQASGIYKLVITDAQNYIGKQEILVHAQPASTAAITTASSLLGKQSTVTSYITIFDKLKNVAAGDKYTIKLSLDSDAFSFVDTNNQNLELSTIEGYKIFQIRSRELTGTANLIAKIFDDQGKEITQSSTALQVVGDINVNLETSQLQVGGKKGTIDIRFTDAGGKTLSNLNSRAYMSLPPQYGKTETAYVPIIKGAAKIPFTTAKLAGKDIPVSFQVAGINEIITKTITILPEKAMKVNVLVAQSKIEADIDSDTDVTVELRDRYNNLVFDDTTHSFGVEFSQAAEKYLQASETSKSFTGGVGTFQVKSTGKPGLSHFKVEVTPTLEQNSFEVKDGKATVTVQGVSQAAGSIETLYFWNKEKIQKKQYNSLYTNLLGANYGDIEKKDYLAGALVFDPNSRALAVTSTINPQSNQKSVVRIRDTGNIIPLVSGNNLMQDIKYTPYFSEKRLGIGIFNAALNQEVTNVRYNFPATTKLNVCGDTCDVGKETSISGKSLHKDYQFYLANGQLHFVDSLGKYYFSVAPDGRFTRTANIDFEVDTEFTGEYLRLILKKGAKKVGILAIKMHDAKMLTSTRDELFTAQKNEKNALLVRIKNNQYTKQAYNTAQQKGIEILYHDMFGETKSRVENASVNGYENYENKAGLGWKDENVTLLEFSAGASVGEAVRNNASISVINIGDPVISLKKLRRTFVGESEKKQFDSTLGTRIAKRDNILDYKVFDYNADEKKDILLLKRDKYVELLERVDAQSGFLNRGNLLHIADLKDIKNIHTGNFSGNNYDSIFYVNTKGEPVLLLNTKKDFTKLPLKNKFNLQGMIVRSQVFDMDADGFDDIVTLEDTGKINIYYANGNDTNPSFSKNTVAGGFGITLSNETQTKNGLLYFDGLYQVDPASDVRSAYKDALLQNARLQVDKEQKSDSKIDKQVVDNIMFEQISYQTKASKGGDIDGATQSEIPLKTFIKSEYAKSSGITIEKVFRDINEGTLKAGDTVKIDITIKNISNQTRSDIIYLERIEKYFQLIPGTLENSKNTEMKDAISGYDFGIDAISLRPNESIVLSYQVRTKNISYGYIKAGLFEKGEAGDDSYGDIVLQASEKNCGKAIDIFRSTDKRSYALGDKKISCDETELPQTLQEADKIQKLADDEAAFQKYAKEKLKETIIDTDNDGIPDDEDFFISTDGGITLTLGGAEQTINKGLDELENTINGLSCGFNNGSCIATPLNWAPFAPGNDPTFMGKPIGDGLKVGEGIPIFSAMTWDWAGPLCLPISVHPASRYGPGCNPGLLGAGGRYGTTNPMNFFRLFVTPTLTGGIGTSICFGPAEIAGNAMPKGLAPLFPGGNCIVIAKPILGCSNDGSNGDPASLGVVQQGQNQDFGFINGNCPADEKSKQKSFGVTESYAKQYLQSKGDFLGVDKFHKAVEDHSQYNGAPLVTIGGSGGDTITITSDDLGETDFADIEKVVNKRVSSFPSFLMGWMTAQIEEIKTKLTDFTTLFIILPDFRGIYDSNKSWEENSQAWLEKSGNNTTGKQLLSVDGRFSSYPQTAGISEKINRANSGIKEAYEFIGSFPLVKIEEQPIHVRVPWIAKDQIDQKIIQWKGQISQYKTELQRAKKAWSMNGLDDKEVAKKIEFRINGFIDSLEKNIEILETYKNIPQEVNKFLQKKEEYLDQIMCNIEGYSQMMSGWLSDNGKRFKAWVELYILIKAILKSWQKLIDIFIDYEAECKECKNERGNLLDHQFKLVSMLTPSLPIVKFPKWPDIILDLHNIRMGVTITLPELEIQADPLVLPDLPVLYLPDVPTVDIDVNLPDLELLEPFTIKDLGDLPSLPVIKLPDLPPPPKLPKLFSGFSVATDIVKLVTKAMCILKMSPFTPEWRAGDQIAFLTERNGFKSFDFFNTEMPQFELPWVDAIEVTSYVNLEYETDFIIELAKQAVQPINEFTGDFTNKYNIHFLQEANKIKNDIEQGNEKLNNAVPNTIDIDIDVTKDGIDRSIQTDGEKIGYHDRVGLLVLGNLAKWRKTLVSEKDIKLSNTKFKQLVFQNLSQKNISENEKLRGIQHIWKEVDSYTFSKEDAIIQNLQKENSEKFEALKSIIRREAEITKQQREQFGKYISTGRLEVARTDISDYNSHLQKYNEKTFQKIDALVQGKRQYEDPLDFLAQDIDKQLASVKNNLVDVPKGKLLAQSTVQRLNLTPVSVAGSTIAKNSCTAGSKKGSTYVYEGIYILEGKKSYRLFDYVDGLTGKEEAKALDMDNDGDSDFLYMYGDTLYMKTNLKKHPSPIFLGESGTVIPSGQNVFLTHARIPAPANVKEVAITSNVINVGFSAIANIYNYRLSYFDRVDKHFYEKEGVDNLQQKKYIVDGVVDIEKHSLEAEDDTFKTYKNLATIEKIGNFQNIQIETKELHPIKNDIRSGNIVFLSPGTKLYTGNSMLVFQYLLEGKEEVQTAGIAPNSNIQMKPGIRIVAIQQGQGYVTRSNTVILNSEAIRFMKGLPILPGAKISFNGTISQLANNSYIDIRYYDGTLLALDFNDVAGYELYNLGNVAKKYLFSLMRSNDYYYGRIQGFGKGIYGTLGKQVLLAPQKESDYNEPVLDMHTLKVPVYQKKSIDITNKIFEDGGITGVRGLYIDYDIEKDTNKNGNKVDDNDMKNMDNISVDVQDGKILLNIGPFDEIISKKISINITDINGNTGYKTVDFEVYAPNPEVQTYNNDTIFGLLDEPLTSEPINMYRYRSGGLQKLRNDKNKTKVFTKAQGEFSFDQQSKNSGLVLTDGGTFIASIDELTGRIDIVKKYEKDYGLFVKNNTKDYFPEVVLRNKEGDEIFRQTLRAEGEESVYVFDDGIGNEKNGIIVQLLAANDVSYYTIPNTIPYNGGSLCIYSDVESKVCDVIVFKDGRVKMKPGYSLKYLPTDKYITIQVQKGTQKLANIKYKIRADYIIH